MIDDHSFLHNVKVMIFSGKERKLKGSRSSA